MKKHFVKFMSPGTFCAEETVREIDSWDANKAILMAKEIIERHNSKPYGFKFFTRERTDDELDSKITQTSGTYYINGKIETLEEIKAKGDPNNRILISNMECNGWDAVVTTYSPWKWTQPFGKDDKVVIVDV